VIRIATRIREARLRPEASGRFPGAPAGIWLPAGRLATECLRAGGSSFGNHLAEKRLPDDAFEFRGGRPEAPTRYRTRTRWADRP
jgi:hypothetical protein